MNERLQERRLIMCQEALPARCVHCELHLPAPQQQSMMMINIEGEAVVCTGPVSFCTGCDAAYVEDAYYAGVAQRFEFDPYTLVGFIDYELLPPDKRDIPIGEDPEQPVPLVEFKAMQALKKASFE
ncbi:MAG: hypothetical protein ACAI44_10945 [Candidatus Sericytochromatia bacterium]